MIEKIEGFEIHLNNNSKRIINIDISDEILNKLIFPFNKFDITALEYKPFTRFTIAKSLDDLSGNKLSKFLNKDMLIGLAIINPIYFICMMLGAMKTMQISLSVILGAALGPAFYFFSPEWSILFGGFLAGTIAFLIGEKNDN